MFSPGQDVEIEIGGSLGRWVPAQVVAVERECCGKSVYNVSTRNGRQLLALPERQLRRPRKADVGPVATAPKPKRARKHVRENNGREPLRFDDYRRWVKAQPCIFCRRKADDPHHFGPKGMGQTTDDTRLTPVCRVAHDALHHRRPDELCAPLAYLRDDPEHCWAVIEAHVYEWQGTILAQYLRVYGQLR